MPDPLRRFRRPGKSAGLLAAARTLSGPLPPPDGASFGSLVHEVQSLLDAESPLLRPRDLDGLPGGLLELPDLPTVLVPDLHARPDFLAAVLEWRPPLAGPCPGVPAAEGPGKPAPAFPGVPAEGDRPTLAALLEREEALLVCLGDAFHSEGPGAPALWELAYREYLSDWAETAAMDKEMGRALACVELILRAKAAFPAAFHYLKGNHDNIVNEEGRGDHGFYKFASEGEMVASWFELRYGRALQEEYRRLELSLPVAVRGRRFVASHAEPGFALSARDIVEYRHRPDVVEALTWTPNEGAEQGSVASTLAALLGPEARGARWFGGHRPVGELYALRAKGLFVQFHNPLRHPVAFLRPGAPLDPELTVLDLG